MPDIQGDRLYVNLGASQVRRRLKGVGYGVRKVQSAGRNQAVVIHTATGGHLAALEAIFADVGCAARPRDLQAPIESLPNLGPASALWLREAGIGTIGELARRGPVVAYRLVKARQPAATLNLLWSLAAGLAGKDGRALTDEEKAALRRQLED